MCTDCQSKLFLFFSSKINLLHLGEKSLESFNFVPNFDAISGHHKDHESKYDNDNSVRPELKRYQDKEIYKFNKERFLQVPESKLPATRKAKSAGKSTEESWQEQYLVNRVNSAFVDLPYCPDEPTEPHYYPIMDLVNNWNPDNTNIPPYHYNSICRMDYIKDYDKALRYRDAEMPFILVNIPEFEKACEKWSNENYLRMNLHGKRFAVEVSKNNHFMYYQHRQKNPKGWEKPTEHTRWTYDEWLKAALRMSNASMEEEHYYLKVTSMDMGNGYGSGVLRGSNNKKNLVFDDISIFKPEPGLFLKDPSQQHGIHCRFGMNGVIAEAHFDAPRNMVAEVAGTRRWFMAHPRECKHSYLLPLDHPSGRHTAVDWSKPDLKKYPLFRDLQVTEVLLTPGEVLYVPAYWIHSIVNLDMNIQCNSRSGNSKIGRPDLKPCGFF